MYIENEQLEVGDFDVISRRGMLKNSLGFTSLISPYRLLANNILLGMHSRKEKFYLNIQTSGAPPRWHWDLLLNPYNDSKFEVSPTFGTRYFSENGRYVGVEHELIERKGISVPYLWQFEVPAPSGPNRMIDTLLDNAFHVRGLHSLNVDHAVSLKNSYFPFNSSVGNAALIADKSMTPFPATNVSCWGYYLGSNKGISALNIPLSDNVIKNIMSPYNLDSRESKKTVYGMIKEQLEAIKVAEKDILRSQSMKDAEWIEFSQNKATELIMDSIGDLDRVWNDLYGKYQDLITRSFSLVVPGINDLPIGIPSEQRGRDYSYNRSIIFKNEDLRSIINNKTKFQSMAESMAVSEFLLRHRLSGSICIGVGDIYQVGLNDGFTSVIADEHFLGYMPSMLLNSMGYLAISSCLLELIDILKKQGIFNRTYIHVASEFNRNPRSSGDGSDHAYNGASSMIYSGSINGPVVVGNILQKLNSLPGPCSPSNVSYPGTWGAGAIIDEIGGTQLDANHMPAILATLMDIDYYPKNDRYRSIISRDKTGIIRSLIGPASIVDA